MDLDITCQRCKAPIAHVCDADLVEVIVQLYTWTPETGMPEVVIEQAKKEGSFEEGDDEAPFVSEAFLYLLFGKDDARSLMGLISRVIAAAGVEDWKLRPQIRAVLEERATKRKMATRRDEQIKLVNRLIRTGASGLDVVEEDWPLLARLVERDLVTVDEPRDVGATRVRHYRYHHSEEE